MTIEQLERAKTINSLIETEKHNIEHLEHLGIEHFPEIETTTLCGLCPDEDRYRRM